MDSSWFIDGFFVVAKGLQMDGQWMEMHAQWLVDGDWVVNGLFVMVHGWCVVVNEWSMDDL